MISVSASIRLWGKLSNAIGVVMMTQGRAAWDFAKKSVQNFVPQPAHPKFGTDCGSDLGNLDRYPSLRQEPV